MVCSLLLPANLPDLNPIDKTTFHLISGRTCLWEAKRLGYFLGKWAEDTQGQLHRQSQ